LHGLDNDGRCARLRQAALVLPRRRVVGVGGSHSESGGKTINADQISEITQAFLKAEGSV
jgi:hypothetical protein